jgi:hypothetical protein
MKISLVHSIAGLHNSSMLLVKWSKMMNHSLLNVSSCVPVAAAVLPP